MLRYKNGKIVQSFIDEEPALIIYLNEDGQSLSDTLSTIINSYKKHAKIICFSGEISDQKELSIYLSSIKENGINTAIFLDDLSSSVTLIKDVTENLDYVVSDNKIFTKDYCPFSDSYEWI